MRHRVTLWIALATVSACAFTDLDGYSGGGDAKPDGGNSSSTTTSSTSSSGVVGADASADAGDGASSGAPDPEAGVDAAPTGCIEDVLVGSNVIAPVVDDIAHFAVDAYGYTAAKSGTGTCIWIYIETVPPSAVVLGVYAVADGSPLPAKLVADAVVVQPRKGWNAARASAPIPVKSGAAMWIGVTALQDGMQVREYEQGSCGALYLHTGGATGTTKAPDPFPAQIDEFPGTCTMSAYVSP